MNLQLKNKVIIITYDSYNIFNHLSQILLKEEAIPIIIGKENIKQENYFHVSTDISLTQSYKNIVDSITKKFGSIDGLINNVSQQGDINIEHTSPDNFMQSIEANTIDCFLLTQQVLPVLKNSKGSIINITLHNNKINQNNFIDARTALTREWAVDFLQYEIRVNALVLKSMQHLNEGKSYIANAVVFLLSKSSSHTTGQIISVD